MSAHFASHDWLYKLFSAQTTRDNAGAVADITRRIDPLGRTVSPRIATSAPAERPALERRPSSVDGATAKTGRIRRLLLVSSQVPGHELGFQQSGHARYLDGFLEYFHRSGFEVALVVLRPNVDFLWRPAKTLNVTLMGPSFWRFGRRLVLRSPGGIARLCAWAVYAKLPRFVQAAADTLRLALRQTRGYAHTLGQYPSARDTAYVRGIAASFKPDVVMYDGIFSSCGSLSAAQHWVITHDVKHQRAASFEQNGIRVAPASFTEDTERDILEQCGNVIAIQWDEATEFRRLAPRSRVVVVPVTMTSPQTVLEDRRIPGRCLFVGSGSYHNLHGIRWFLKECWPKIREAMPTATLDIVGSVCLRLSEQPVGVRLRGVVKDLDAMYNHAALTIVPLQIGSGLKVKLVEALANEQAIVTTSVGAQGLTHFSPSPFVVADSSADFTVQTVALLQSPARQKALRANAVQCARAFTPHCAFAELDAALSGDVAHV
jgi:hypothetical protein